MLSQQVLLSLLQQLGYDLSRDSTTKLTWIRDAALALDPQVCADPQSEQNPASGSRRVAGPRPAGAYRPHVSCFIWARFRIVWNALYWLLPHGST